MPLRRPSVGWLLAGGAALTVSSLIAPSLLGWVAAIGIVLIPGASLGWVLFPRPTIDGVERILVSVAMGIAALALGGLAINLLKPGLTSATWLAYAIGLTVACLAVARHLGWQPSRVMGSNLPALDLRPTDPPGLAPREGTNGRLIPAVLLGVAFGLVGLAVLLAQVGLAFQPSTSFSELWLLQDPAATSTVQLGIRNMEHDATTYSLRLLEGAAPAATWSEIRLEPGDTWERLVVVGAPSSSTRPIQAILELANHPGVTYRSVTLSAEPSTVP